MRKKILLAAAFILCCLTFTFSPNTFADDFLGSVFSQAKGGNGKQSGPIVITSDSMDMDIKNNLITLVGDVVVNDPENKLTADKMLVYLQDNPKQKDKKELKAIVALGHVVMIRKAITQKDKELGSREAHAGRADYDAVHGIIVLTQNPVLYQGGSYIKGTRIILWKDSDRMKVEGGSQSSRIVINQTSDTSDTDTNDSILSQ